MMPAHTILLTLSVLLAGCSGPIALTPPAFVDDLLPGRSLRSVVDRADLPREQHGLTVERLTGARDTETAIETERGDLWSDPVPTPQTLGQLSATLHQQGELPANAPAAPLHAQPRPQPDVLPTQTP